MEGIAIRFEPGAGGFFGGRKKRLREFMDGGQTEFYLYERLADGFHPPRRVLKVEEVGRLTADGRRVLVKVGDSDFKCSLVYQGLKDSGGTELDLALTGRWRVADCREFLKNYAWDRLNSAGEISALDLERLLKKNCGSKILDEVGTQNYEDLAGKDVLPQTWWQKKLAQWGGDNGLELLEVEDVVYESDSADRREELKRQGELDELEAARDAQGKEHELKLLEQQAGFRQRQEALAADAELSAVERDLQLKELERRREQAELEARHARELAELEFRKEKAKRDSEIYRIRNQLPEAEEILEEARRSEARTEEMLSSILKAQEELVEEVKEGRRLQESGLQNISHTDRLNVSGGVVSVETLALLGRDYSVPLLAEIFRANATEHNAVRVDKLEMLTRDIGTRSVETLAVGDSLNFQFVSDVGGHVTVLNIGTSGKVWLHSPNAYVGMEGCVVESGRVYRVPGTELLPGNELSQNNLAYHETGPTGWEEMVVVVSKEPLVSGLDIAESSSESPLVELAPDLLLERIEELPRESWKSGVLGFLVVTP